MKVKQYLQLLLMFGLLPFTARAQGIYTSDSADDYNIYVDTEEYSDYASCGSIYLSVSFNGQTLSGGAYYPNVVQFFQSTASSPGVNYPYSYNFSYEYPSPYGGCWTGSGSYTTYLNILNVVGVSTDDEGKVVVTGDDYNTLVSQGFLPAGAGVAIAVTQPELIPILTATIVVVGAIYITYQAATYIKNMNYDRLTRDHCIDKLTSCLDIGYSCTGANNAFPCYRYCVQNGGTWPTWSCPM